MLNLPINLPFIYLVIIAAAAFLALFFITFWLSFVLFEKFSNKIRKDVDVTKEASYQEALKILDESKKRSIEVLKDANARAKKVLDSANVFSTDAKKKLEEELKKVSERQHTSLEQISQELLGLYKQAVMEGKEDSVEAIKSLSEGIKHEVEVEVEEFKEVLHKETVGSQEEVKKRVNEEYKALEKELAEYKQSQYEKINKSVYKILAEVSKKVIGEVLSLEDHQELVLRVLEKAKEEGSIENV